MSIRHPSIVYVRGKSLLDLKLDELNCYEGKLPCRHINSVHLQYTYDNNLFGGKTTLRCTSIPSLHMLIILFWYSYFNIYNLNSKCTNITKFQPFCIMGGSKGIVDAHVSRFL